MCEKGDRDWECARECGREPTAPGGGEPTEPCNAVGDSWEPGLVGLEGARDRRPVERLKTVGD
jgi:hypothetical protein